ncbi:MAG: beta-propeller domain-containing protein [DPANN group archaeon]|nr:beta-propeller domain-containing protein [DPANN group archaeon]
MIPDELKTPALVMFVLIITFGVIALYPMDIQSNIYSSQDTFSKFNSIDEIKSFLKENQEQNIYYGNSMSMGVMGSDRVVMEMSTTDMGSAISTKTISQPTQVSDGDFSKTNIQVDGVDEGDIVKSDGSYIYVLSGNTVSIINAYPAESAKLISNIDFDYSPNIIYINNDKLIVIGNRYVYSTQGQPIAETKELASLSSRMIAPDYMHVSYYSVIDVYDVSDRSNPILSKNISVDGNYFDSRMIGDYVYIVASEYVYDYTNIRIPELISSTTVESKELDVYHFNTIDNSYSFTTIISVNVQDDNIESEGNVYLLGGTQEMYVSQDNIYVVYQKRVPETFFIERAIDNIIMPLVSTKISSDIRNIEKSDLSQVEKQNDIGKLFMDYIESLPDDQKEIMQNDFKEKYEVLEREIAKETEKTVIHKISIAGGNIEYSATGNVSGRVLNQFSMDEYDNHFRIATTTGRVTRAGDVTSANHIYVLDSNLEQVGALEDLAPGESIYSARFMGEKGYLVTFQKIDPLFVIDLSQPTDPKVLGKLKIPGYSDYLHPYDENHLIGIGKVADPSDTGNFAWYQGVKIALFDVTDVSTPKEISSFVIGDRGTDSYALQDHKAFLFSRDKNLLSIPITLAEIDEDKYPEGISDWTYGDYVFQGAYIFDINLETGIGLRGTVTHNENTDVFDKGGWYYYGSEYSIKRSLYIADTLYTVSDGMVKMNNINDLEEVNKVNLPVSDYDKPILY